MMEEFDQIKIRRSWPNKNDFDPNTKIEICKIKKKNRSTEKQNLKKIIKNVSSLEDLDDLEF